MIYVDSFCRHLLHHCFQALMDHGVRVSEILADAFSSQLTPSSCQDEVKRDRAMQLGLNLGMLIMLLYQTLHTLVKA